MAHARTSGILLHPTSLPGGPAIGDLGAGARDFVEFLQAAGQRLWQVLPLGPVGYGNSPYASPSAFAGNPLLISAEQLVADGYLLAGELPAVPDCPVDRVDYAAAAHYKRALVERAWARFCTAPAAGEADAFFAFLEAESEWLDDYALYEALGAHHGGAAWYHWPVELRERRPEALAPWREKLSDEIGRVCFGQFLFFRQWAALREYAAAHGVTVMGDMPIYLPHESADVWAHPELFKLDDAGMPEVVAGVPPDYFSDTGQLWGNPVYDWSVHEATGFRWWVDRIEAGLALSDVLRIDHFRGFAAGWEVAADSDTAIHGAWVTGPGRKLFDALEKDLGALAELPLVAEDLGLITDDVVALREGLDLPGMVVLQFAFEGGTDNPHLPDNHRARQVVYTGTHDNDTTVGWFLSLDDGLKRRVLDFFGTDGSQIHEDLIFCALASPAETCVVPMQDVLGLGSAARMNTPGQATGNWTWRLHPQYLTGDLAARLAGYVSNSGR
ncbi:MAG: 4-alpha-glucanotransferase [Leptospirillia bacterium]